MKSEIIGALSLAERHRIKADVPQVFDKWRPWRKRCGQARRSKHLRKVQIHLERAKRYGWQPETQVS